MLFLEQFLLGNILNILKKKTKFLKERDNLFKKQNTEYSIKLIYPNKNTNSLNLQKLIRFN